MKKLFRILIPAVLIELALCAILFKYWKINYASLFPVFIFVYLLIRTLRHSISRAEHNMINFKYNGKKNSFEKQKVFSTKELIVKDMKNELAIISSVVPFIIPFIFFFNAVTKTLLCFLMFFVWAVTFAISGAIIQKKAYEKKKREIEEELKDQIEREQTGYNG